MLAFVATPIGNLDDFSKRAIETLLLVDEIYCEDTRHSRILLEHYNIDKPLFSYHKFNEKKEAIEIVRKVKEGIKIGVISDAGTPCLSDPGMELASLCIQEKIPFTAIPGPCSPIQALLLSGFFSDRFQFVGFLPKKGSLRPYLCYPGVTVAFESPHRLLDTLTEIEKEDPQRELAVVREMTKRFEEVIRGKVHDLIDHFTKEAPRGEIVLCINNGSLKEEMTISECVEILVSMHGLSQKEAIKEAASILKKAKREVYSQFHKND